MNGWRRALLTPKNPLFEAVFAIAVFIIYFKTLAPSVSGGDSGDLLTAICSSGVPHPPGYPLYVLLGKVFLTLSYFGVSPAWAINFSSAIYGTLTALLLLLTVTRLTKDKWSGFVAGGMFAFSPIVWRYAITSEVFALNNLLACTIFYLFVLYLEQTNEQPKNINESTVGKIPHSRLAGAIIFVFGLGLSNHHSLLFVGLPVTAFLIWDQHRKKKSVWKLLFPFFLGLTPYLYLPWAGSHELVTSWGQTDTLPGFLSHLLRDEYGTFRLTPYQFDHTSWGDLSKVLYDLIFNELIGIGIVLAALGVTGRGLASQEPWGATFNSALIWKIIQLCILSGTSYFVVFFVLNQMPSELPLKIGVHLRFMQLLLLPIYILVGLGISKLANFLRTSQFLRLKNFSLLVPSQTAADRIIPLFCLALVSLQVGLHFKTENQNENYASYRYAKAHLESLPEKAILLLSGDGAYYPINYLQSCEHYRNDVSVLARGLMVGEWMIRHIRKQLDQVVLPDKLVYNYSGTNKNEYGFTLKDFLDANYGRSALYITGYDNTENKDWENFYTTWPTGFTNIIFKRGDPKFIRNRLLKTSSTILGSLNFSDLSTFPRESWENNYFITYKETYSHLAMILAISAKDDPKASKYYLDLAEYYFQEYFKNNPFPNPLAFKQKELIEQERNRILSPL